MVPRYREIYLTFERNDTIVWMDFASFHLLKENNFLKDFDILELIEFIYIYSIENEMIRNFSLICLYAYMNETRREKNIEKKKKYFVYLKRTRNLS